MSPSISQKLQIRVRGLVQGVGFRPTVYRLARELGIDGQVSNDGEGVMIVARGSGGAMAAFVERLLKEPPPLARVEYVETARFDGPVATGFWIVDSETIAGGDAVETQVAPVAVVCAACAREVLDPCSRRFRYPFTTCTHCGPRLPVVTRVPYDRARTTLLPFALCVDCRREYEDPADRRFHAETTACHRCGPRVRLERLDGRATSFDQNAKLDDVDAALGLLHQGEIVAIKGLGGLNVLGHTRVPSGDGGLALGQAVVAAAQHLASHRARGAS